MTSIPAVVPPLPRAYSWKRNVPRAAAYDWLSAGWRDFTIQPAASISYGVLVFLVSVVTVVGLFALHLDYILFPAFAGFMVAGPIIGIGLYEKSRRIEQGEPVRLWNMIFVKPESGGQILFAGVLLLGLTLLWMRAAVILSDFSDKIIGVRHLGEAGDITDLPLLQNIAATDTSAGTGRVQFPIRNAALAAISAIKSRP